MLKQKDSGVYKRFFSYLLHSPSIQGSLSFEVKHSIFLRALTDYFDKTINEKELGIVADYLYYAISKPREFDENSASEEFGRQLLLASKLEYYNKKHIRHHEIVHSMRRYKEEEDSKRVWK
jgi:hypothetical protein